MTDSQIGTDPITDPGERRVTSDTGASKGTKLARFDMIPTDALWELAEHYGKGAEKYEEVNGKDNWRSGYEWSHTFAAAFRHMTQALGGQDIDPGTGSKHVIAAAWHMFTLAHWMNNPAMKRFDNRQDPKDRPEWNRNEYVIPDYDPKLRLPDWERELLLAAEIGNPPSETRKILGMEDA